MLKFWHVLVLAIVILVSLSFYADENFLYAKQNRLQWEIGNPRVNAMLHSYSASKADLGILTDYRLIQFLPGFEGHFETVDLSDPNAFLSGIKEPNITHALLPDSELPAATAGFIRHKLGTGEYTLVGQAGGYFFIRVR